MESVQQTIQKMKNSDQFLNKFQMLKNDVLNDPAIQKFISEHPSLPEKVIDRNISRLFEFKNEHANCLNCLSIDTCSTMMKGYQPKLFIEREQILIKYHACAKKIKAEEQQRQQRLIKSMYVPKEIFKATFDRLDQDNRSRILAIAKAVEFATTTKPGETAKGLYMHGKFGVGKTFIMGAIANELA